MADQLGCKNDKVAIMTDSLIIIFCKTTKNDSIRRKPSNAVILFEIKLMKVKWCSSYFLRNDIIHFLFFFLEGGASVFQGLHNIIHHHALEARWQRDIQPYHYDLQPSKTFNEMNTFTQVFSVSS